jgi:6-pyruvoyltetrahydropterin/6-carboxytetrahydropterin synthase
MVALTRTVRFAINPDGTTVGTSGFGGIPAMQGLARFYQFSVQCKGEPDPITGYLVDIRQVDRAVRSAVVPIIAEAVALEPTLDPAALMQSLAAAMKETAVGPLLESITWHLSPYYLIEMNLSDTDRAIIRISVDLAAAHRLHVDELSAEQNRAIFGRCNNPNGHGHNYRVETAVAVTPGDEHPPLGAAQIEQIIDRAIIQRFDHKHLNLDTEEFAPGSGCIPSVENMARVFFGLLESEIADAHKGATLASVTIWETDRTCGTYPG